MNILKKKKQVENLDTAEDVISRKVTFAEETFKEDEDRMALVFIWIYTGVEAAATSMVNPLIPAEALRHDVDLFVIGLLFFVFALSSLLTSLFLGKIQSYLGRRNIILMAFMFKIFTYFGFLMISSVKSKPLFIMIFAILHITQGMSSSAYQTAAYSSLTIMFPDKVDYVIGWFETFSGIGFSFGPAIGSVLFSYGGYQLPFIVFLVVLIWMTSLTNFFLPQHLNRSKIEKEEATDVSYFDVLKNKRIMFAWIILGMNAITYDFLNPILSDVMNTYYGMSESMVGWMFCLMGWGYIASWQLTNFSLRHISNRRLVMLSLALNGVFIIFLGPSKILGTSPHLLVTCFALFFSGATSAHFVVPIYSEIIEPGKNELGIDEDVINDLASGLSTTVYALGQMVSFTVGGFVYEKAGFSGTIDATAILIFIVSGIYFIWCDKSVFGSRDFKEERRMSMYRVRNNSLKQPLMSLNFNFLS